MRDSKNLVMDETRSTSRQIVLCLTAYLTALAPSMSIGFSAIALPSLTSELNPYKLTDSEASWFASVAAIATPFGSFISGPISDRFGRKPALLCVNVVTFLGWLAIAIASYFPGSAGQLPWLLVGRLLTGLSTGLISMPATVYMAEVSSSRYRLFFTTASAIAFALGVLTVYALGFILKDDWGTVSTITTTFPIISLFLSYIILPESPAWLVSHGRPIAQASRAMSRIYGASASSALLDRDLLALTASRDLLLSKKSTGNIHKSFSRHFTKKLRQLREPKCLRPLLIMITYFAIQQFSGTFVIVFYAITVVRETGAVIDPYIGMMLIGLTRFATSILICAVSSRIGRRPPSIFSGIGITLAMATLSIYTYSQSNSANLTWLPICCLVLYFFASTVGFVTVPFAMAAEVFPVKVRGTASGLVTTFAYSFNFVVVKTFGSLLAALGNYGVFGFFAVISFLGTIFLYRCLPETKGKSLAEVEALFTGKSRRKSRRNIINIEIENEPLNSSLGDLKRGISHNL